MQEKHSFGHYYCRSGFYIHFI